MTGRWQENMQRVGYTIMKFPLYDISKQQEKVIERGCGAFDRSLGSGNGREDFIRCRTWHPR